jgi:hypothetical protein
MLVGGGLAWRTGVFRSLPEAAIRIDVGRQLFVDDYLVSSTSMRRTFHKPRVHDASPVLKPETTLEMNNGYCPVACPFNGGVFYDRKDQLHKMWYQAGWFDGTAYAFSEDGIRWIRPHLSIEAGTNRVLPRVAPYERDGDGVWLDETSADPSQRFKMFIYFRKREAKQFRYGELYSGKTESEGGNVCTSPDGIHWSAFTPTGPCGDNTNFFYNPFRKKWFYSVRTFSDGRRIRSYRECADFVKGADWTSDDLMFLGSADDRDLPDPELGYQAQLYNLDAVAYESLMLGVFAIHKGPPNEICEKGGFPKITDLTLAFSRDGINWDRPDRSAFLACSRKPGTWNRGYLHSAGGVCLIVRDQLHFYFAGFSGISPRLGGHMYAGGSTGLATLRRDGFASMDAGPQGGILTTPPLIFSGQHLFVNANAQSGELRVEAITSEGEILIPFTRKNCRPIRSDSCCERVTWKGAEDLSRLRETPISLRFHVVNAQLYSFWISPSTSGASHGYVAAGGPGFTGAIDTVGPNKL